MIQRDKKRDSIPIHNPMESILWLRMSTSSASYNFFSSDFFAGAPAALSTVGDADFLSLTSSILRLSRTPVREF